MSVPRFAIERPVMMGMICAVIILIGGIMAALWKLGILADIGTTWTVIGIVILIGLGVMFSVSNSGTKENIQIDRK